MVQALLKAWNFYIGKPILVMVTCYLLLVVLGLLDFNTGNQLSFSFLYLMPVLLITWVGGGISGAVASFVSVVIWQLASYLSGESYPTIWIPIWNSVSRLIFILFAGVLLLDKFHQNLQLERNFARTDFLTGTANRRAFFEIAGIEINRAVRYCHHISVIYIDLDELKSVNDSYGHRAGDALLRLVGRTISRSLRTSDLVARVGGDEFCVLLPEAGEKAAKKAANRIFERLNVKMVEENYPTTFSFGVVSYINGYPKSVDEMIQEADTVMYEVKKTGKNNIRLEVC
jgi:diguanylate cyclase (GGDEF)-like protein